MADLFLLSGTINLVSEKKKDLKNTMQQAMCVISKLNMAGCHSLVD